MPEGVDNRATIEAFWRARNEARLDDAIEMYAPDARLRHLTQGIEVTGATNIRDLMAAALALFPDRRSDVVGTFSTGDDVITENRWQGTLASAIEYRGEAVPAVQHMTHDICYVFHFVEGKVAEQREYG
jgi:ketosteroid isomerase-like protein